MLKYGRYIPKHDIEFLPLSGQKLFDLVKTLSDCAGGLDGWQLEELKLLPVALWDLKAKVYELAEKCCVWPESLKYMYQIHAHKPGAEEGPVAPPPPD